VRNLKHALGSDGGFIDERIYEEIGLLQR
jgi:hypothetical protein